MKRPVYYQLQSSARPVGWAVAFEMSMKAQAGGFKLGEVPIISVDRLYGGKSTFRVGAWTKEYLRWFLWGTQGSCAATHGQRRGGAAERGRFPWPRR